MRTRTLTALLILISALSPITGGCATNNLGPGYENYTQIANGVGPNCRWSKDGKSLYYLGARGRLYRYDLKTRRTQKYLLPDSCEAFIHFDVSPNGEAIVYSNQNDAISVVNLKNRTVKKIYEIDPVYDEDEIVQNEVWDAFWVSPNTIVFTQRISAHWQSIYRVDMDGRNLRKLNASLAQEVFVAHDGSRLMFRGPDGKYHLFDLERSVEKPILPSYDYPDAHPLYMSRRILVYNKDDDSNYIGTVEAMDMKTGKVTALGTYDTLPLSELSPDFTKTYAAIGGGPDWYNASPSRLYLVAVPSKLTEKLRQLDRADG